MHQRWQYLAGFAGVLATGCLTQGASAQTMNQVVGALNAVLNPNQALQLEDRARREGRPAEERYWERYRAGLETQGRYPDSGRPPGYAGDQRPTYRPDYSPPGRYQEYGSTPYYNQPRQYPGYGSSSGYPQGPGYQGYGGNQGYPANSPYVPAQPNAPGYGR